VGITERPPKILILAEASVVHSRRWTDHFRLRGWTVRWLSFPPIPPDSGAEALTQRNWRRALAILMNIRRVRRIVDEFSPDIISALFLPDYGWLATLCKRHPVAVSAWGSDVLIAPAKSRWHRRRIESVLRRADWLFADAELLGQRMRELGADPNRMTIAPLGVDDSWLDLGQRRTVRDYEPLIVMTCRRMEPLYRVDTFLRAAANLVAANPKQFDFVVVGDGSQRDHLEQLARSLGLSAQIRFTGSLDQQQLQTQLSSADLYVSCSSSDGTSVSMLEAMAAGCAPIVTDLAVNHEWIDHGGNGLFFPVGDDRALAAMIQRAATDSDWRRDAADRNHAIITQRARWRDNMTQVEDAMLRVIEKNRARAMSKEQ
jgi:glycosyltransferase involved in cell wall biosynthesis